MTSDLLALAPYWLGTAALTFGLTALVRRFALARGIAARPRERDMHTKPVPRLGGVAIVVGFLIIFLLAQALHSHQIWFTPEFSFGIDRRALGLLLGILILLIFGIADDIKPLSAGKQLLGQSLAAFCLIFAGVGIAHITNPFGPPGSLISLQQHIFSLFHFGHFNVTITLWSDLFTYIWLVGMMNVMNWFDGLDGLAAGVSAIAAVMLATLSIMVGSPIGIIIMLAVLFGALVGFLPWNWWPAKIFMGTAGSTVLGFILGTAAIISGGKVATALLVLGVPVLDALWVVARRLFAGQPIFIADRRHLHHRLVDAGLSVPHTVLILYTISFVFGAVALWQNSTNIKLQLAFVLTLLVVIIGLGTVMKERIKYQHG